MATQRLRKIESLLVREVSDILMREIKDPRVAGVTITGAKVSADLQHATVYFQSGLTGEEVGETTQALEKIKGAVRRIFGKRVRMKYLPDIHFRYDASLDYADRIEKLLKEAAQSDAVVVEEEKD